MEKQKGNTLQRGILITGGLGFIGLHLIRRLLQWHEGPIVVLDNLLEQVHGPNAELPELVHDPRVKLMIRDLNDRDALRQGLDGVTTIVHLASETGTGQSMYESERYMRVNVLATAMLCDLLTNENHQIDKIVLSSSRAVYGEGKYLDSAGQDVYPVARRIYPGSGFDPVHPKTGASGLRMVPTDEFSHTQPVSVYGSSKLAQEHLLLQAAGQRNIDTAVFRIQNAYGPGQSLNNPYTGIIPLFTGLALMNRPIDVFEDGLESRDFIHVSDVVQALERYLHSELQGQHVMNLGTGSGISILDLVKMIVVCCESSSEIRITGKMRKGDIRHNVADIRRIRQLLNFKPVVRLEDGMAAYIDHYKNQGMMCNLDAVRRAIRELDDRDLLI